MRARLLFVMIASGCAVQAVTACSSPDVALESEARRATQTSSVTVAMFDGSGNALGSCSGTLVAKDVVLTAGHCAAGAAKWSIDAHGADATSEATHAVTPWKAFGSDLSHPDHSDVALLILDKPIVLDSYPGIATSKLSDGAKALRFSRASAASAEPASTEISVSGMSKKGFRLNYAAKIDKGGFVDTGGAIIDPKTGKIHGVISGVGKESGLLHIARVDNFAKWITNAKSCTSATSLATKTYGTSSGGSSSWGGSSSGGSDWGGYGGDGAKLDGGGSSSGSTGIDGGVGSSGSSGSSGSTGSTSGGTDGSSSGSSGSSGTSGTAGAGGADTSGAGSSCPGVPTCTGSDCPGVPGSGSGGTNGSSGTDGANGGTSGSSGASGGTSSGGTSGTSGGTSGTSGSSGSDGTNAGGDEVCPGPPSCPEPDSQACTGAACGGCGGVAGCVDATIDYGSCASCGTSNSTGTAPVVR